MDNLNNFTMHLNSSSILDPNFDMSPGFKRFDPEQNIIMEGIFDDDPSEKPEVGDELSSVIGDLIHLVHEGKSKGDNSELEFDKLVQTLKRQFHSKVTTSND